MQHHRLKIIEHRPFVLLRAGHDAEEKVEQQQRQTGGEPAAEEFAEQHLVARDGLGQQREQGPMLALRRDLPRRGRDGDDQGRRPDEEQANLLEITDDVVLAVLSCGPS